MPPCDKKLKIKTSKLQHDYLSVYCCDSEGHSGKHHWNIWTDDENPATEEKGIIKVIH